MLAGLQAPHPFSTVLDAAIVGLSSDRGTPAGCLLTKMRLRVEHLGPETAAQVRTLEGLQRDAYQDWYARAVAKREANADLDPAFAARYIDTQFSTILVQMAIGTRAEEIREQARLAVQPLLPTASA